MQEVKYPRCAKLINNYFCNAHNTTFTQIILSFTLGLLFSPWSYGVFFIVLTIILYELLVIIFTKWQNPYFCCWTRCGVVISYLFGYFLGRFLAKKDLFYDGFN